MGVIGESDLTGTLTVPRDEAACAAAVGGALEAAEEGWSRDGTRFVLARLAEEVAGAGAEEGASEMIIFNLLWTKGE